MACHLTLLGGFSLKGEGGAELALSTRKDRLLLSYLALSGGRPQARDRLAGLLWGDRGEVQARDSLRQSLAAVRATFRQAGLDPLQTDRETVTFDPAGISIDTAEFTGLASAEPGKAAALYQGDLLEGVDGITPEFEEWLRPELQRLRDLAAKIVEDAASSRDAGEGAERAIALGRRLIAKDRLREGVYRALMCLHARTGDRVEALKLYATCREVLQQELGVAPDARTEEVHRSLLAERADTPMIASGDISFDRLSIAVLPFDNLSGDPQQQYFSDGFSEDIITELSRFHALHVMARNSSFAYRGGAADVRKVGRELGVRFVVEGSIRRSADSVRISAQLLETTSGNHLWADRYDRPISDLFAIQDEVVQTIVVTIAARLEESEVRGANHRRTDNLAAYDCLLRGIEHARGYGPNDNRLARELFERAIALDPHYALAHAYRALTLMMEHGFESAPAGIKQAALDSALESVKLDPNESRCHQFLGQVYLYSGQHDQALFHLERSLALNRNDPHGMAQYGFVLAQIGRAEEGVGWIERAMRLNPFHPAWYWADLAVAQFAAENYEAALTASRRQGARTAWWHARMAACHAQLGRIEEARTEAAKALAMKPNLRVSEIKLPYKFAVDRDRVLNALRKAGLPD